MTTPLNTDLDVLRSMSRAVADLEAKLDQLRRYRNDTIVRLRQEGLSVIRLATAAEMTRGGIYLIVNAPPVGDEGEGAEEYAAFSEQMTEMWTDATTLWQENGFSGSPDDYFPLGEIVDAR